ncbi:hypothetical protein ACHHYP_09296 [Achlya hypogyna]|uniref:Uncharacterized protein n=1 Tax=Achlya hypogyna TaxID=1202772 RepID=A0A1V9YNJ0_ACHHY|nr:hypothetical protein ACHHYP_09296 [Achlya hypogyna]
MTSLVREVSVSADMDTSSAMGLETAFVFGWNNLLCPTDWIQRANLTATTHTAESQVLFTLVDQLDVQVVTLLAHALSLGPVYVVVNDFEQATLALCTALFPRAKELLFHHPGVLVVYADASPSDGWYAKVVEELMKKHAADCKSWDVAMALFGTDAFRGAVATVSPIAPSVVFKCMSFSRVTPTILECAERLKELAAGFDDVAFNKSSVDIVMHKL